MQYFKYWVASWSTKYRSLLNHTFLHQRSLTSVVFNGLKTLDTIGNCQRPVFSLRVSPHNMHKITNLWKFGLNWSKLRDNINNVRTNYPGGVTRSCVLSDAWFWDLKILILRYRNQIRGKWFLSRKLRYFRGTRFS